MQGAAAFLASVAILASGTLAGKFSRENTKTSDWTDARQFAHVREQANSWTPAISPATPPETFLPATLPSAPSTRGLQAGALAASIAHPILARTTIRDACAVFYMNRQSRDLAEATLSKYRTFTKQLIAFAENRGYVMIDQSRTPTSTCSGRPGNWASARRPSA